MWRNAAFAFAIGATAIAVTACDRGATRDERANSAPDARTSLADDAGLLAQLHVIDASPSDPPDAALPFTWPSTRPYETATPLSGKSIGHTSVVFKLGLSSGLAAAFKPESRRGHARYRGEIAAYRLSRALGLANVPPAIPRCFDAPSLRSALQTNDKARALFRDEVVITRGSVRGALIPWIADLAFLPVESEPLRGRWTRWLSKDTELPSDQRSLAAQISTLIVFDTLTGNWDRWSGANVGIDKASGTLLFVDNDGAFFDPVPAGPLAAQLAILARVDRFSRSLVARLRALGPIELADAIGEEAPGEPLIAPRVLAGVDERRRRVLAAIDAKIAASGPSATLPFE